LLLILALFAAVPALVVSAGWFLAFNGFSSMVSGKAHWEDVANSGKQAIDAVREAPLTPSQRAAVDAHEEELANSLTFARRVEFISPRFVLFIMALGAIGLLLLAWPTWRVAGHLSRQLSRPVDELVGWTQRIARNEPLPPALSARGAPEFDQLQEGMRAMSAQLEAGRSRALEAERLRAFRESSRQFAHELKNPLTPIRFAVSRLKRDVPPELRDAIDVLATESERLEGMARSFAQFGRLPEGPAAEIDVAELVTYTARAVVPDRMKLELDLPTLPRICGHYDSLSRALTNVLLNAVEACEGSGMVHVSVTTTTLGGQGAVRISVRDSGPGIPSEKLATIWSPYVTHKAGGTGLGLAIARQSVEAHGGEVFATSQPGSTEVGFVLPVNAGLPAISGEPGAG
jgi:signal transduction histidine kinase